MMKPWLKWTLIALPLLVGGFIVYKRLRKSPDEKPVTPTPPTPTPGGGGTPTPKPPVTKRTDEFPLKRGSKGARVRALQVYILNKDKNALPKFGADGDFGKETEDALIKLFGKKEIFDQAELNAIKEASKPVFTQGSPLVFQYQQQQPPSFIFK